MARYLVNELSFIDNRLVDVGAEIEFNGVPAGNLTPLDAEGEAAAAEFAQANADSADRQALAAKGGEPDAGEIDLESLARQQAAAETGDPDNGSSLA